jgi:hypothetical protein
MWCSLLQSIGRIGEIQFGSRIRMLSLPRKYIFEVSKIFNKKIYLYISTIYVRTPSLEKN